MREITALLKQEPGAYVTTMFDLYRLPLDWPGREEPRNLKYPDVHQRIENSLKDAIRAEMGSNFDSRRFIPYLQVHEYEAILFSDPVRLAESLQSPQFAARFTAIVDECGGCEKIDDDPETAPSKRIEKLVPGYQKTSDGVLVAQRIGLETIRDKCPHFHEWLDKLESLA
jgi:Domain of unknown function (DUF4276)